MSTGRTVPVAFNRQCVTLPLENLLPLRRVEVDPRKSPICRRIAASIREVGLIEPLVVYPQQQRGKGGGGGGTATYLLLDGHVRLEILRQLGHAEALCLVATEDEAYTYNHKVNQVSPIQEHFMILKAIESGVSEERIAASLDIDLAAVRQKRDLLKGICREAVDLLRDKRATAAAMRELRKVRPMRQIEMAELMIASNNFSASYAKCLLAATPEDQLLDADSGKDVRGLRPEDVARMEREMEDLGRDFRVLEDSHGRNVLHLVLAVAYLRRLLDNARVTKYLAQHHPDILAEFQKIVAADDLEGGG